jgi:hypothetical protein
MRMGQKGGSIDGAKKRREKYIVMSLSRCRARIPWPSEEPKR